MEKAKLKNKTEAKTRKRFLLFVMFFIGFIIFSYPFISMILAKYNQTSVISEYVEEIKNTSKKDIDNNQKAIDEFNKDLHEDSLKSEGVSYVNFLNTGDVMGYIEIPKIKVLLPIYQGTSGAVLKEGVGHIEKSSLPTSYETAHVVLTGHTGLPTSKLFTELDKLELNDIFHITVLNRRYTYTVDQIKVVLPTETKDLQIENGKNMATLITCTPYMINSHRLLVRGIFSEVKDLTENTSIDNQKENEVLQEPKENITANTFVRVLVKEIEYVDMPMIIIFIFEAFVIGGFIHLLFFKLQEDDELEKNDEVKPDDLKDNLSPSDYIDKNIDDNDFQDNKLNKDDFTSKDLEDIYNKLGENDTQKK